MDFKVGDIIKGKSNDYVWTNERMKRAKVLKVKGNDMTIEVIEHFLEFINGARYTVKNSTKYFELIEEKEFTKSDLQDGDIVTLRNGLKYRKSGGKICTRYASISLDYFTENLKYREQNKGNIDVIKVERPVKYETIFQRVEEEKKEILDKVEKNYLKIIIKPIRSKIKYIEKDEKISLGNKEFLVIYI